jgi:hypothetical protein
MENFKIGGKTRIYGGRTRICGVLTRIYGSKTVDPKINNPYILLFKSIINLILILWKIKNPFILLFESKIN